jgi:hypothetical protein
MTIDNFKFVPKMKEDVLERLDIEVGFTYKGIDTKEKYLVLYSKFPDTYHIYPASGGNELAKAEVNAILRYYVFKVMRGDNVEHREITIVPFNINGVKSYREI